MAEAAEGGIVVETGKEFSLSEADSGNIEWEGCQTESGICASDGVLALGF